MAAARLILQIACAAVLGTTLLFSGPAAAADALTAASELPGSSSPRNPVLTIGLLDTLVNPLDVFALQQTSLALAHSMPQYRWRIVTISSAEALDEIKTEKPDFLFAPAGFFSLLASDRPIRVFHIAKRKPKNALDAEHAVGAAFVVRADRDDMTSVVELKGKNAIAALPNALDGWLAAAGELIRRGFDPENFFSHISFRNNAYPDVLSALLAGDKDVGILPACMLESLSQRHLIDSQLFRVIGARSDNFSCQHSTVLYPDISFLALPHASEEAVRDATIALLSLGRTENKKAPVALSGVQWVTNASDASVLELYRTLQIGPYAYLRDRSLTALLSRHRTEVGIALLLLIFLLLNELRLVFLVKKRTRLLRQALVDRDHWENQAGTVRKALIGMERRSTLEQMSGMIAHEVNSPVGSIRTYVKVLTILQRMGKSLEDGPVQEALRGIEQESQRLSEIISRVRQYARTQKTPHVRCNLAAILDKAVHAFTFERSIATGEHIETRISAKPAWVLGDSLELEILLVNLLRNSFDAMETAIEKKEIAAKAKLIVTLGETEKGNFCVTIDNPGPAASDADLEHLQELSLPVTSKPSGLGLGLTICRGIADSHGAALRFAALPQGGIRTILTIAQYNNSESQSVRTLS